MLSGIAIVVLLLAGLLAIPVYVKFSIQRHKQFAGSVTVRWAFDLVNVDLPLSSGAGERATSDAFTTNNDDQAPEIARKKTSKNRKRRIRVAALLKNAKLRRRILRFITDFWASFRRRAVTLNFWYGLDDPADTGFLCAITGPVAQFFRIPDDVIFRLEPVFTGETLELDAHGEVWLRPLTLLALLFTLLLSPTIWCALYKARS